MSAHKLSVATVVGLILIAVAYYPGQPLRQTAPAQERVPVIVELFTSEGCSSCPPADDALIKLAATQPVPGVEIIAMSEHVDYWNNLGWTDPFSAAQFSQRQNEYARAFGIDGIYTPQMVVDGREEFIGNDISNAVKAISRAGKNAKRSFTVKPARIDAENIRFQLRIDPADQAAATDVFLAIIENNLSSNVKRGENEGRTLAHTSVVRKLTMIGSLDRRGGFAADPVVRIDRKWKPADLRVLVFTQDRKSKQILAAQLSHWQQP